MMRANQAVRFEVTLFALVNGFAPCN